MRQESVARDVDVKASEAGEERGGLEVGKVREVCEKVIQQDHVMIARQKEMRAIRRCVIIVIIMINIFVIDIIKKFIMLMLILLILNSRSR